MPSGAWVADAPKVVLPDRERMKTEMEALIHHFKIVYEGFNVPAGEVYLAPVEGTAEGVLALAWAPNRKLASPLRVVVKGGLVREVEGDEPFRDELLANLGKRPENRNIAELGIGANDKAERPDNILESEKILGTVHIAFGDNSSMGGRVSTPFHQDFVFFRPTMTVEIHGAARTIISAGRLLV